MVDGFGPRETEHLAKLQDNLSKYDLSPEETLKTERALNCLLFHSSTIVDNVQEDSGHSLGAIIRKLLPCSPKRVVEGLNKKLYS